MPNQTLGEIIRRQNPATLPTTATVQAACRLMRNRRVGAVLVIEDDGIPACSPAKIPSRRSWPKHATPQRQRSAKS
jgi:hypothetical protein